MLHARIIASRHLEGEFRQTFRQSLVGLIPTLLNLADQVGEREAGPVLVVVVAEQLVQLRDSLLV
jgi:hypothetical protein